ncbi:hypothetical protein BaRGS_00014155 [Batillaria attramentaria]|uniref:Uncharacterized protein n=1 Tax=Batillaria attramentaria TaxID=370345 RepID=A0ABD0L5Y1_9CAEN
MVMNKNPHVQIYPQSGKRAMEHTTLSVPNDAHKRILKGLADRLQLHGSVHNDTLMAIAYSFLCSIFPGGDRAQRGSLLLLQHLSVCSCSPVCRPYRVLSARRRRQF